MAREFYGRQEAADYLGLKPNTMDKWRYQGGGPRFVKLGSAVRYERCDLDAFIDDCKRDSTSDQRGAA